MPLAPSVDARSPRASRRGEAPTIGKERLVNASRATTLAGYALLVLGVAGFAATLLASALRAVA